MRLLKVGLEIIAGLSTEAAFDIGLLREVYRETGSVY